MNEKKLNLIIYHTGNNGSDNFKTNEKLAI